jgi:hypothetical protein
MNAAVEQVQLEAIQRFARSAEAFCALMESSETLATDVFVRRSASALAALYHDMLELPDLLDDSCDETFKPFSATQVYANIRERMKRLDAYFAYFDPYDEKMGMWHLLNDDLGDIYLDVYSGLETYRQGTHCDLVNAVFTWKFLFSSHWGHHLVSALTALHAIITGNLLANDE